jgi:hypothetical protein
MSTLDRLEECLYVSMLVCIFIMSILVNMPK